jgi:8-oxo-dGTP pyrophosphatase MutT (NUDIX family)
LLRRGLPLPQPLIPVPPSFARLAQQLAGHKPIWTNDPGRKWAAVALILAPDPDSLLLIRRAERVNDPWSGHVGLPGGRQESRDSSLLQTAIRETAEEIGLPLSDAQSLGALDDVVPRTVSLPPIAVRPFVFALDDRPLLVLSDEIAAVQWIPLRQLRDPATHAPTVVSVRGESLVVPAYVVGDLVVWGMTERILSCFFQVSQ